MLNLFTDLLGKNDELSEALHQAQEALQDKKIDIIKLVFETPPGAYEKGYCTDKDAAFFGFAYKKRAVTHTYKPKRVVVETPPPKVKPKEIPEPSVLVSGIKLPKLTDRETETFRSGIYYVCPCGKFKCKTIRGFKKHFNRCQRNR